MEESCNCIFYDFGITTIEKNCLLIKDQWKSSDIKIFRVSLTVSSQPSSYRFCHSFGNGMTSVSFLFTFIHRMRKSNGN